MAKSLILNENEFGNETIIFREFLISMHDH